MLWNLGIDPPVFQQWTIQDPRSVTPSVPADIGSQWWADSEPIIAHLWWHAKLSQQRATSSLTVDQS